VLLEAEPSFSANVQFFQKKQSNWALLHCLWPVNSKSITKAYQSAQHFFPESTSRGPIASPEAHSHEAHIGNYGHKLLSFTYATASSICSMQVLAYDKPRPIARPWGIFEDRPGQHVMPMNHLCRAAHNKSTGVMKSFM